MTEQELRMLVRESIARQLARPGDAASGAVPPAFPGTGTTSFARFVLPSGADGTCIIEPAVACTHCGFCKSYGH